MRDPNEILALYHGRKDRLQSAHAAFKAIRAAILNEIDIPLPELDTNEKPAVANLILTGITQTGNRIASTLPTPFFPALRPGIDLSEQRARTRTARVKDWQDKANLRAVLRKRAIHYLAYAAAPVVVKPNPRYRETVENDQCPITWEVRDPLATYMSDLPVGQVVPDDAIFAYTRTKNWIEYRYGQGVLDQLALGDTSPDMPITLLEFIDENEISTYAISNTDKEEPQPNPGPLYGTVGMPTPTRKPIGKPIVPISVMPNRAGRPLCVMAGMISLERPQSLYEGLVGIFQNQARLMALELIGLIRTIWPEQWAIDRPGEQASVVTAADPLAGVIGELQGADMKFYSPGPAQFGMNHIDRLERSLRVQAGIPAEYGGESATNVRTDKRGNSILSATIDFSILAAHESFETSLREENRIAADIEKSYFPGRKTFATTSGQITYDPADVWEQSAVGWMRYPSPGSDADSLVVAAGQRIGIGTMSKRTFMETDPLIDDPEEEMERVRAEQLEQLLFGNLQGLAQQDPNYMTVIAKLDAKLRQDQAPDVLAAWLALDTDYKQQQQAQQQQVALEPGAEQQPGLAQPGAAIQPPDQNLSALGQLTRVLQHTSRSPQPPVPAGVAAQYAGGQG